MFNSISFKKPNQIFFLLVVIGVLFFASVNFANATSLAGGNCTVPPGGTSCRTSVTGNTSGLTAGWVGQLYYWYSKTGVGILDSFAYPPNSSIYSEFLTETNHYYNVTLVTHNADWSQRIDYGPVRITAFPPPSPSGSLSGGNCPGSPTCNTDVTWSANFNGWSVYFWTDNGQFVCLNNNSINPRSVTADSNGTNVQLLYYPGDTTQDCNPSGSPTSIASTNVFAVPPPSGTISASRTTCTVGADCTSIVLTWSSSNSTQNKIYVNGVSPAIVALNGSSAISGISSAGIWAMTGAGSYTFCMNGTNGSGMEVNMTPPACTTTITASVASAPTPALTLSGPVSGPFGDSGQWTNTGGGVFADIMCRGGDTNGNNCWRGGSGWGISNAAPNSSIEWFIGKDPDPTSGAQPSFGAPFTSKTTGSTGSFQECPAGTNCANDWSVGRWRVKVRIPPGTGVESNEIIFRIWPAELSFRAAIETYENNQEVLKSIDNGLVTLDPNNVKMTSFPSYETKGVIWNVYPKLVGFTAGVDSNLPGASGNTNFPNAAAIAVVDNNGVNLSDPANGGSGVSTKGTMSVSRIDCLQGPGTLTCGPYKVPTFTFRSKETRIKVFATLNGSPWNGTLPNSFNISATGFSQSGSTVNSNGVFRAGVPRFQNYTVSYSTSPGSGPSSSNLTSIGYTSYTGTYPSDVTRTSGTSTSGSVTSDLINAADLVAFTLNFGGGTPTCSVSPSTQVVNVNVTATGAGGTGGYTWTASGGTPSTGAGNTFSTSYSTAGTKTITVTDSALNSGSCTVDITLTTIPATLSVVPTTLNYSGTQGGSNPAPQSVTISNTGSSGTSLTWTSAENTPWLFLSAPTSGTLGGGSLTPLAISIDTTGLAAGSYSAPVTISAGSVAGSPQTVTVNLTVTFSTPVISLSCTNNCEFIGVQGGANPGNQTLSITNSGGGTLNWSATKNAFWLALGSSSGSTPGGATSNVSISINTAGMLAGIYRATITVTGNAGNSPQIRQVTLKLGSPAGPNALIQCNDQPAPPDCKIKEGESIEFLNNSTP